MSKIKRPTLATTRNCIMLLKETLGDCKAEIHRAGIESVYMGHATENLRMMLTMLTDESWMNK